MLQVEDAAPKVTVHEKPLLSVRGLRKTFGEREILKGISFDVMAGQTLVLIGPSGSGKTTVLRCLNYLETPSAGLIELQGEPIGGAFVGEDARWQPLPEARLALQRSRFGFVFQRFNLFPHLTALEKRGHRPAQGAGRLRRRRQGEGGRATGPREPRRPHAQAPVATLRRAAAAGRHRPRARHGAAPHPVRRAHFGPSTRNWCTRCWT